MNPAAFKKLVEGMTSDEIFSAAIESGLLENKDIHFGDVVTVPHWLAEILYEQGIGEPVEESA
jgi:hypothetical protein